MGRSGQSSHPRTRRTRRATYTPCRACRRARAPPSATTTATAREPRRRWWRRGMGRSGQSSRPQSDGREVQLPVRRVVRVGERVHRRRLRPHEREQCPDVGGGVEWVEVGDPAVPEPDGLDPGLLYGVSCVSASACTAVGGYDNSAQTPVTLVEAWNGSKWTIRPSPSPTGAQRSVLYGVRARQRAHAPPSATMVTMAVWPPAT